MALKQTEWQNDSEYDIVRIVKNFELGHMLGIKRVVMLSLAANTDVRSYCRARGIKTPNPPDTNPFREGSYVTFTTKPIREIDGGEIDRFFKQTKALGETESKKVTDSSFEDEFTREFITLMGDLETAVSETIDFTSKTDVAGDKYISGIRSRNESVSNLLGKVASHVSNPEFDDALIKNILVSLNASMRNLNNTEHLDREKFNKIYKAEEYEHAKQAEHDRQAKQKRLEEEKKRRDHLGKVEFVNDKFAKLNGVSNALFNVNDASVKEFSEVLKVVVDDLQTKYHFPLDESADVKTLVDAAYAIAEISSEVLEQTDRWVGMTKVGAADIQDILREKPSLMIRDLFDSLKERMEKFKRVYGNVEKMTDVNPSEAEAIARAYSLVNAMYNDVAYMNKNDYMPEIDRFSK